MSKENDSNFYRAIGNSIQENKDKIEKLEKQVDRLKKKNKQSQQELDDYKERNEKAIEYIKEKINDIKEYDIDRPIYSGEGIIDSLNVLLEILDKKVRKTNKEEINKWFEENMCVSFDKFVENWEEQKELTQYLQQKNNQLQNNWNTLKEWLNNVMSWNGNTFDYEDLMNRIQEIESRE